MVPRHLPKKLLCVALIGTSILAVIYYTNGISNSSANKLNQQPNKDDYLSAKQHNKQTNVQNQGLKGRNDKEDKKKKKGLSGLQGTTPDTVQ